MMRKLVSGLIVVALVCVGGSIRASDQVLGKIFVKAADADAQGFVDPKLEDSVKDVLKNIPKKTLVVATDEKEADFLLIITERKTEQRRNMFTGSPTNGPHVYATLSVREGDAWKPGIKVHNGSDNWGGAAKGVVKQVEQWLVARAKK